MSGCKHHMWSGLVDGVRTLLVLALVLAPAGSSVAADEDPWSPTALTGETGDIPDGREVIQRAIDFMQSQDRVGFEAVCTYEVVQENGQKLQFAMLQRVAIQRPERMHWVTLHDDASTETAWCHDGTFTMVKQPANVWGRVDVPPALSDALSRVAHEYNVPVPLVDLLSGDAAELWLGEDVEWVNYIAETWAYGQWTDHVALRKPGADVQLWFRKGDEPFPVKMVIVHTDEDGLPGFSARFREWSTRIPDGAIPKFVPPEGSRQLELVPASGP
jgi:hypothetical protein